MNFNKFSETSNPVTLHDIQSVEKEIGLVFPKEMIDHYLRFNGGFAERNRWEYEEGEFHCVHGFIPIKHPSGSRKTIEEVYKKMISKNLLPKTFIPFARDPGGNFFCTDENGKVYYYVMDVWDDELSIEQNQKTATELICNSFAEFIDGLVSQDDD